MGEPSPSDVRARLLAWYDANRRDLPWRRTRNPYHILVAEYLLQRTRIASGIPYYERFLERFPTLTDLASAPLDEVMAVWEGLGFYGRARNLHSAARAIVERHGGEIPRSLEELSDLPGIGPYTAGAVGSIAFGIPVPAVDGNVTRVIARLFRIRADVTSASVRHRVAEIATRFSRLQLNARQISVTAAGDGYTLAQSIAEVITGIGLQRQPGEHIIKWSELVEQKRELWPIQYLLPGGAYIR